MVTIESVFTRWAALDEEAAVGDLAAVVAATDGPAVGVVGFCLGGTLALVLHGREPRTRPVCFYGFPAGSEVAARPVVAPLSVVGSMPGPILGFWGGQDAHVSLDSVNEFVTTAVEAQLPLEATIYTHLDHAFLGALDRPGATGAAEAQEAWRRTLAYLDRHVSAVGGAQS
jgi:carboxymethylenebutenolidase